MIKYAAVKIKTVKTLQFTTFYKSGAIFQMKATCLIPVQLSQ